MKAYESHESAENYLESILILSMNQPYVHSIDIANMMNFSKPSVSIAMKHFREEGKIIMDEKGCITLTETGLLLAKSTYEKHVLITDMLVSLGVSSYTAAQDACRIEHVLSPESFRKLSEHYEKAHHEKSDELERIRNFHNNPAV